MTYAHALWMAPRRPSCAAGIGASLLVHGLLISLWQLAQPQRLEDDPPSSSMVVRLLRATRPEALPAAPPRATTPAARAPARQPARQPARREHGALPAVAPRGQETITAAPAPEAEAPAGTPAPSARELLSRAKLAVGEIDRALRKENPQRGIVAPVETAQMKLEKGIAEAADLAPNKWYQATKTQEIMDAGGYGRKRYRVVGAAGTYCVTYESNRAPDGLDAMRHGIKPKVTSCPPNEGPSTTQKWNN